MFKIIPNTNDLYEIDEIGNVKRIISNVPNSKNSFRVVGGNILSQKTKRNGYKEVNLHLGKNATKMQYIHRLVAITFIGEIPKGYEINHIDGNKANNSVTNLEIVSHKENSLHSTYILGNKAPVLKGSKHGMSKIDENIVLDIREQYYKGIMPKKISEITNIPLGTIRNVCYKNTWKHI